MLVRLLICFAIALASPPAAAQDQGALSRCLADNTSGKERKELARWVFLAMAAHPEMKALSAAPPTASEDSSRAVGGIFMRLLTETCVTEARAAVTAGGGLAIQTAFQALGQLAMQELMTDRNVAQSMSAVDRYVDSKRLGEALGRR